MWVKRGRKVLAVITESIHVLEFVMSRLYIRTNRIEC